MSSKVLNFKCTENVRSLYISYVPIMILGFENKTFVDYLKSKDLTDSIMHYVLYAIAMGSENTPCMSGVEKAQKFLSSLGRYGNTPFLWPMYGSGELPQCFCRYALILNIIILV